MPKPTLEKQKILDQLLFKKHENLNPTRASHLGMSLEYLSLAKIELLDLQQEGLIKVTNSTWTCQAFYVNKWSEQIRRKLRLIINY